MENLKKYTRDVERLIAVGEQLGLAMLRESEPNQFKEIQRGLKKEDKDFVRNPPSFSMGYQAWYSEAKALVRQLLPDRIDDFCSYYEKPKSRKDITCENYRISDYLQGLKVCLGDEKIVGLDSAIPLFDQQLAIVEAVKSRFKSSLFDIKKIVQADLFDSELESAKALVKHGFLRSGGALAGVVLEKHLVQVREDHGIKIRKKSPTIADLNDFLKNEEVIDTSQWRFNQHLADIRNLCDHHKEKEPTDAQVNDLIDGVMKVTKTLI